MRWQNKARIMKACASLPRGDSLYKHLQKNFGRLNGDPTLRINTQIEMARWLANQGIRVEGKRFCEVGTGHKPIAPIGLFLSGAESVITIDLNRRIDLDLTAQCLGWLNENRRAIEPRYLDFIDQSKFDQRFELIRRLWSKPELFLQEAGIRYLAPADAADTHLPDESVDCHFSTTVLEHIPASVIREIFIEAKRILAPDGVALHFIDPSDHFQHDCVSITKINFLRFSESEWSRLAGNEFAYCNRLRASDFLKLFDELGFDVVQVEKIVDDESKAVLKNGFVVDKMFGSYEPDDLCTTDLNVMLKARRES